MRKVFLSYSRADSLDFARELHRRFVRDGIQCFFDEASIEWGTNYSQALADGLDEADHIIVILSPGFIGSEWTKIEHSASMIDDPANLNQKILPLLFRECEIPRFLKPIQYLDVITDELFDANYSTICQKLGGTFSDESNSGENGSSEWPESPIESEHLFKCPIILDKLKRNDVIHRTKHSTIESVTIDDKPFVVKITDEAVVDFDALKIVVGEKFHASNRRGTTVSIATPEHLWKEGNRICELYPYFTGMTLNQVIERNICRFSGSYLGEIFDLTVRALSKLHEFDIVHRDVTPHNMFLLSTGNIVLLDPSFACLVNGFQMPTEHPGYSAPEQLEGNAVPQSDFYSLAATVFYLVHGHEPKASESIEELDRKTRSIDFGAYSLDNWPEHLDMIRSLFEDDVIKRPASYRELLLTAASFPTGDPIRGVFDLDELGFLIMTPSKIFINDRLHTVDKLNEIITKSSSGMNIPGRGKVLRKGRIPEISLADEISSFFKGDNPWLRII